MNKKYESLLEKAERILKTNIYEPGGYRWGSYRMISPAVGHFLGIWNWDSAFHAIGMIPFDIEIAKEQIEGFFEFQLEDGMLPDAVFENGNVAAGCTKPPVMAYAAWRIYDACGDVEFVKRIYPKLVKNEKFWTEKRKSGELFHYDAVKSVCTDEADYLKHVGYETGWDNSPRWDNSPQSFWAVDLNCYMIGMYRSLAALSEVVGKSPDEWQRKAEALSEAVEEQLWNEELGSYADFNFVAKEFSKVLTPASFMPLLMKTASSESAEKMAKIARNHFLPGMPTVAYDDDEYDDEYEHAYWRGPCWLNTAYFAAKGLMNYGYTAEAEKIRDTILGWVLDDGECIHENYNATTGEGLCSDHFSWSCVFVREFIENF